MFDTTYSRIVGFSPATVLDGLQPSHAATVALMATHIGPIRATHA
jgi:hypothetical protein